MRPAINSMIDGRKIDGDALCIATLKSGPRCLNDEMSENFADTILAYCDEWAHDAKVKNIDFTYGVLYGTKKQSNKKDWHILRFIADKHRQRMIDTPDGRWHCKFEKNGVTVTVTIRIGIELWTYVASNDLAFMEISTALLRACVKPTEVSSANRKYTLSDLEEITSIKEVPILFNAKILQRSQLEWLFFFARHFCDALETGDMSVVSTL